VNTCHYLLDNGLPCRAPALHNGQTCRHHTPEALARRQLRLTSVSSTGSQDDIEEGGEPIPPAHLRAYWRIHHSVIAESTDDDQCQQIFDMILMALGDHAISPRSAGKLLQAVMDRRKIMAQEAQEAAFRLLEERVSIHRRQTAAGEHPDAQPLLEALTNTVFSSPQQVRPDSQSFGGSKIYSPSG
jgi:hypothetical protein